MAHYSFVTRWRIEASLEQVWDAVYQAEQWPRWWKGVEQVLELESARGENGVGALRRFTWKSRLPYRLTFQMRVTRVMPHQLIESSAEGELEGTGRWTFSGNGKETAVRYDWNVRTTKLWMNLLAPVARPLFKWNHDVVMKQGEEGLRRLLKPALSERSWINRTGTPASGLCC